MPWLDPSLDIVFRLLFADPRNEALLVSLLEALLEPHEPILDVEVQDPELPPDTPVERGGILRVRARLASGVCLRVEMQRSSPLWTPEGALVQLARLYGSQLGGGEPKERLEPVVSVHILDFAYSAVASFHSVFELLDSLTGEPLSTDLELHLLELPKLPQSAPSKDDPPLLRWARFFAASDPKQLEHVALSYPELGDARKALERLALEPEAQQRAAERERAFVRHAETMRRESELVERRGRPNGSQ